MRTNIDIEHRPMRQAMRAADRGLREPPSRRDCGYSFRLTHKHRFVGCRVKSDGAGTSTIACRFRLTGLRAPLKCLQSSRQPALVIEQRPVIHRRAFQGARATATNAEQLLRRRLPLAPPTPDPLQAFAQRFCDGMSHRFARFLLKGFGRFVSFRVFDVQRHRLIP
jgi:hypothetical protein